MVNEGNVHVRGSSDTQSVAGVDTDGNGQFEVSFTGLRSIPGVAHVDATASGGYVANPVSVSGNTVTFELYYGGGAGAELDLVTNGAGVADVNARASSE